MEATRQRKEIVQRGAARSAPNMTQSIATDERPKNQKKKSGPLNSNESMPVPPPKLPFGTGEDEAASSAANTWLAAATAGQ